MFFNDIRSWGQILYEGSSETSHFGWVLLHWPLDMNFHYHARSDPPPFGKFTQALKCATVLKINKQRDTIIRLNTVDVVYMLWETVFHFPETVYMHL